jgi:hypothetical protein
LEHKEANTLIDLRYFFVFSDSISNSNTQRQSICANERCTISGINAGVDRDFLASTLAFPRVFLANAFFKTRPLDYQV